jgi:hypothetical protein
MQQIIMCQARVTDPKAHIDSGYLIKTLGAQQHARPDQTFHSGSSREAYDKGKIIILLDIARYPLGWLSPVTIRERILLQKIWKVEHDLGGKTVNIARVWEKYCQELPLLADIKINRCTQGTPYELIESCDASEASYLPAVYLRSVSRDGAADVIIVIGKIELAHIMKLSSPRLELCCAVLLARLIKLVQCVLSMYTRTERMERLHSCVFVAHRTTLQMESLCSKKIAWPKYMTLFLGTYDTMRKAKIVQLIMLHEASHRILWLTTRYGERGRNGS